MKHIFLDIDGTIIDHSQHIIPPNTLKTIKELAKDNTIWLCTGRVYTSAKVDLGIDIDNYITALGTQIFYEGKQIYDRPITKEELDVIISVARKHNLKLAIETMLHGYTEKGFSNERRHKLKFEADNEYWTDMEYYKGEAIYKVMVRTSYEAKEDLYSYMEELKDQFEFCQSAYPDRILAEVSPKGSSKGGAIVELSKMGLVNMEDTICIGDSPNDVSMFKVCKVSFAMGQGKQEVKEQATYITDSVSDDGFTKAFVKIGMVKA